jgi:hypothetical protein
MVMKTGMKKCGCWLMVLFLACLGVLPQAPAMAQEMPPRPVGLGIIQNLAFGAFSLGGTGGAVTITPYGSRIGTGGVILIGLGYAYFPAIFTLEGNPGTIMHPLNGPDAILYGSNGGTLTMHLGDSFPGDPIILNVAPPGQMQIFVGGTLLVGSAASNPPGYYTGSFSIMFIQE